MKEFIISICCFIFVVYIIIIQDLYEYVDMHHLSHKNDYLRFSFIISIGYFIGFLLIFQIHTRRSICIGLILIGVAVYNTSLFKNGRVTPSMMKIKDVDFVLLTTTRSTRKKEFIKRWIREYPLHVYYSLEGPTHFEEVKNHPVLYEFLVNKTGLHYIRNNNSYNLAMGLKRGFETNFTLSNPNKWIFVFEDDAVLNPRFQQLVQPALNYYKDYDLIWGDVITHADFIYKGQFLHCVSGMIYNLASLKKLARMFDFERREFKELVKNWPYGNTPPYVIDGVIAYNCNNGVLKCGYVPLTHEANNLASSIGATPDKY